MKKVILISFLLINFSVISQTYFTRTGETNFSASVKAFVPVEAINNSTTVLLKSSSGEIAAQLFITAFDFKIALMQEHFNENYMDANKYPKSFFKGKLKDFNFPEINKKTSYQLLGTLTIKGIEKDISTVADVFFYNGKISLTSEFTILPKDFEIAIPSIVRKKIAEKINVSLNYELVEKK
ncbi:YceI family protein [Polaribacter tangerinus]|uniref:YceI family protein n=1 Tax=Polaribacter tangerinus TaxID=1920034 RepID=UPI000B4C208A|nr:YceI family protein [Polaribacter tangerinus]